ERYREWRLNNKDSVSVRNAKYRALKACLPYSLSEGDVSKISKYFSGGCSITGEKEDLHLDHVIPIAVGHGGTIYENMIPLRADLNLSKSDRNIFDWFADNRERFGLEQRKFDELIEYLADINNMTKKEYEEYVRWCHDNPRTLDEIKSEETDNGEAS